MKPPSPVTVTTRRSGYSNLAATAPGSPIPIEAKPFEMMQVFGARHGNILAIHSLLAPTSQITMSSGESAARKSRITCCGRIGQVGGPANSASNPATIVSRLRLAHCWSNGARPFPICSNASVRSPSTPTSTV